MNLERLDTVANMMGVGAPVSLSAQELRVLLRAARLVIALDDQWADLYPLEDEAREVIEDLRK